VKGSAPLLEVAGFIRRKHGYVVKCVNMCRYGRSHRAYRFTIIITSSELSDWPKFRPEICSVR